MKTTIRYSLCAVLFGLALGSPARAQLVADGDTLAIDGFPTNINGSLIIGTSAPSTTLIITNAGAVSNLSSIIGLNVGSKTNRVVVTGANSAWLSFSGLTVGQQGAFNQLLVTNGGRLSSGGGVIGSFLSAVSNVVVVTGSGSTWSNNNALLNLGNAGSFNQLLVKEGGKVTSSGVRLGGTSTGSSNTLVVGDPGSLVSSGSELNLGIDGSANQMIVSNGAQARIPGTYFGANSSNAGSGSRNSLLITGAGSVFTNLVHLTLGNSGQANQLNVADGGAMWNTLAGGAFQIGFQTAAASNVISVTGSNSLLAFAAPVAIGVFGSFNRIGIFDGGQVLGTLANLGDVSGKTNVAVVAGAGSKWTLASSLRVGNSGAANQLIVANGGNVSLAELNLGANVSSSSNAASISDAGSSVNANGAVYVGLNGSYNQLTVANAGLLTATSAMIMGYGSASSNNSVILAGGAVVVTNGFRDALTEVRNGTWNLNSGLLRTDALVVTNGLASLFHFNGGTLQTRSSTHSRLFAVGDGGFPAALEFLGGTNGFAAGLIIRSNAWLRGNGTVVGNVTNRGSLAPGGSIGQLTIQGMLVAENDSTNIFELNKSAGTNDSVVGLTSMTYGGALVLTNLGGTLANGDMFRLFGAADYAGAFASFTGPVLDPGLAWDLNRLLVDGVVRVISTNSLPPVINHFSLLDTNILLGATNGMPDGPVVLVTTTNLAEPLSNWIRVLTNQFDSLGSVSFTNAISSGDEQRFYRLAVP